MANTRDSICASTRSVLMSHFLGCPSGYIDNVLWHRFSWVLSDPWGVGGCIPANIDRYSSFHTHLWRCQVLESRYKGTTTTTLEATHDEQKRNKMSRASLFNSTSAHSTDSDRTNTHGADEAGLEDTGTNHASHADTRLGWSITSSNTRKKHCVFMTFAWLHEHSQTPERRWPVDSWRKA